MCIVHPMKGMGAMRKGGQVSPQGPVTLGCGPTHERVASWSFQMLRPPWECTFSCRARGRALDTGRKAYFWRPALGARAQMTPSHPAL